MNLVEQTKPSIPEKKKILFWIDNLFCPSCTTKIETISESLTSVNKAKVNFEHGYVSIDVDIREFDHDDYIHLLNHHGYHANNFDVEWQLERFKAINISYAKRLAITFLFTMWSMLSALITYFNTENEIGPENYQYLLLFSALSAFPVVFICASHFHKMAISSLRVKVINIDVLISIASTSIFFLSSYLIYQGSKQVYFEAAAMLVFFQLIGRYMQNQLRTNNLLSMKQWFNQNQPTYHRLTSNNQTDDCQIKQLKKDDLIEVRKGESIFFDALLMTENAIIDQSLVTGESEPVFISLGGTITSGSSNLGKPIIIKVLNEPGESSFDLQMRQILELKNNNSKQESKINIYVKYIFLLIISLSLLSSIGVVLATQDYQKAIEMIVTILAIACPCTLTLALPIANQLVNQRALNFNIHVNDNYGLSRLAKVNTVIFDKTGTLTNNQAKLSKVKVMLPNEKKVLAYAALLSKSNNHIFSQAIYHYCRPYARIIPDQINALFAKEHEGLGVSLQIGNESLFLGSYSFISTLLEEKVEKKQKSVYLAINNRLAARFEFDEQIKDGAEKLKKFLQKNHIDCFILSGDSLENCIPIATQLNIDFKNIHAGLKPKQKLKMIQKLQNNGRKCFFVGDGLNDNLSLAGAEFSMALAHSVELTKASSSAFLLNDSLLSIKYLLRLAATYEKVIVSNFFFAIFYNLIALSLAILGYIGPALAPIAMVFSLSSLLCNSLRLSKSHT